MERMCKFPQERLILLKLAKRDQNIRIHGDFERVETILKMSKIDLANQKQLEKILKIIKTPTTINIGEDGAEAVWLIAQHSGYNLRLMKRILQLMRQATKVNPKNGYYKGIPYLVDRINIMEGKPQVFGTQFWASPNGKPEPYPIVDENKVEGLRRLYGIRPFSEYQKDILKSNTRDKRNIYMFVY